MANMPFPDFEEENNSQVAQGQQRPSKCPASSELPVKKSKMSNQSVNLFTAPKPAIAKETPLAMVGPRKQAAALASTGPFSENNSNLRSYENSLPKTNSGSLPCL